MAQQGQGFGGFRSWPLARTLVLSFLAGSVVNGSEPVIVRPPSVVPPSPRGEGTASLPVQVGSRLLMSDPATPITSVDQLLHLDQAALESLYRSSGSVSVPPGKVKGRVILFPGSRINPSSARIARLFWQGKTFNNEEAMAVNRFFGLKMIKGQVYQDQSWLDGQPALILDYSKTSLLYRPYRDEIREVGPGVYLGLMYSRTTPCPTFKMYFALQTSPCP